MENAVLESMFDARATHARHTHAPHTPAFRHTSGSFFRLGFTSSGLSAFGIRSAESLLMKLKTENISFHFRPTAICGNGRKIRHRPLHCAVMRCSFHHAFISTGSFEVTTLSADDSSHHLCSLWVPLKGTQQ